VAKPGSSGRQVTKIGACGLAHDSLVHSASGTAGISQALGVVSVPALRVLVRLTQNGNERFDIEQT
jgi:hypothetical protein